MHTICQQKKYTGEKLGKATAIQYLLLMLVGQLFQVNRN